MDFHNKDLVFPDKKIRGWQIWNKPAYIEKSPFTETLWIDADTLVRGSLRIPFEITSKEPFMVECSHAPRGYTSGNPGSLYGFEEFYIPEEKRASVYVNAGVMGFVSKRDAELLVTWKNAVKNAYTNRPARECISWYDQGALLWALEATDNLGLIREGEWCFNSPANRQWQPKDVVSFLTALPPVDGAVVRHFTGIPKPWKKWTKKKLHIDLTDVVSEKLKVLVLSHDRTLFSHLPPRPYLEPVDLNKLPIGKYQGNELAESRIYLDPGLMERFEGREYVGLASVRWNHKYFRSGGARLEDLHEYRELLSPDTVIVGLPTRETPTWVEETCHPEKGNPGMERILAELADYTGMPLLNKRSFWSNNFICHRTVFEEFLSHFHKVFKHFTMKYNNRFDYEAMDPSRAPAFFYEAVTVHYFANRTDLTIKRLMASRRAAF
jgi:hypothetical protein